MSDVTHEVKFTNALNQVQYVPVDSEADAIALMMHAVIEGLTFHGDGGHHTFWPPAHIVTVEIIPIEAPNEP
jgi:hypothetical protein